MSTSCHVHDSIDAAEPIALDIGATLYCVDTLFSERIGDRWVLFAPDRVGLPIVVDERTNDLLESFRGGAVVADVLARDADGDFTSALASIMALEERGFLREAPASLPYPVPPPQGKAKNFSIWLHITNSCNLG